MYKRIRGFEAINDTGVIGEIKGIQYQYLDSFISRLKNSLIIKYVEGNIKRFDEREIRTICLMKDTKGNFEIDVDEEFALIILSEIFKHQMTTEMTLSKDDFEKRSEIQHISFEEFMLKEDINIGESFKSIDEIFSIEEINIPIYFSSYRARYVILSKIKNRKFSNKYLDKLMNEIKSSFIEYVENKFIETKIEDLGDSNIEKIFNFLIEDALTSLFYTYRLGKTFEESEAIIGEVRESIEKDGLINIIKAELINEFKSVFSKLIEKESFEQWSQRMLEVMNTHLSSKGYNNIELKSRYEKFREFLKKYLYVKSEGTVEEIKTILSKIDIEIESTLLKDTVKSYFSLFDYTCVVRVEGLVTNKKILIDNLTENIEMLSYNMFLSWREEIEEEMNYKGNIKVFDEVPLKERNSVWLKVKGIKCAKDTDMAYETAIKRLKEQLDFLHYFVGGRNENYTYTIADPYVLMNHDLKMVTVGHKQLIKYPKIVDDFDSNLMNFLVDIFDSNQILHKRVIKAMSLYSQMKITEDINSKFLYLTSIIRTLFKTSNEKMAIYSAIIVSGINYDKKDLKYVEMRKWLLQDFNDFIELANDFEREYLKEEIFERFEVFVKNILGTYMFNIPKSVDSVSIEDIISWIMFITPNNNYINSKGEQ